MSRTLPSVEPPIIPDDRIERALLDGVLSDVRLVGRIGGIDGILAYLNARTRFRFTAIGSMGLEQPFRRVYDRECPHAPLSFDARFEQLMAGAVTDVCSTLSAPIVTTRGQYCGALHHYDLRPRLAPQRETRVLQFVGEHLTSLMGRELENAQGAFVGMTPIRSPAAYAIARQLVAREPAAADAPAAIAVAMQRACTRVTDSLRRTVGDDGCNALIARTVAATIAEHPVLADVRTGVGASAQLDGVVAAVERHGVRPVAEALEAALAALVDHLGGLIGEDMVPSLLELDALPFSSTGDGAAR